MPRRAAYEYIKKQKYMAGRSPEPFDLVDSGRTKLRNVGNQITPEIKIVNNRVVEGTFPIRFAWRNRAATSTEYRATAAKQRYSRSGLKFGKPIPPPGVTQQQMLREAARVADDEVTWMVQDLARRFWEGVDALAPGTIVVKSK
jgi:hypothetical protein